MRKVQPPPETHTSPISMPPKSRNCPANKYFDMVVHFVLLCPLVAAPIHACTRRTRGITLTSASAARFSPIARQLRCSQKEVCDGAYSPLYLSVRPCARPGSCACRQRL